MSRKATFRMVDSDETAEVIVRQSPAELELPAPVHRPPAISHEPVKPAAALVREKTRKYW